MKKLILAGAILFASFAAQAATYGRGGNSITGLIGFSQSAVNFGANYENRLDTMGVGGYFLYSSEKKDAVITKQQFISFGAMAPLHLLDDSRADVYLAPGFGITMVKGISGTAADDDQTVFGPIWKTGALFKMTPVVKIGIEQTIIINWFTDKAGPQAEVTNFAVNFSF